MDQQIMNWPQATEDSLKPFSQFFAQHGLPNHKDERWRYTSLESFKKSGADAPLPSLSVADGRIALQRAPKLSQTATLVWLNGEWNQELSDPLPEGVSLTKTPAPSPLLNLAMGLKAHEISPTEALVISRARQNHRLVFQKAVTTPIHLVSVLAAPSASGHAAHNLEIILEPNTQGTVIHSTVSPTRTGEKDPSLFLGVHTTVKISQGATLWHWGWQRLHTQDSQFSYWRVLAEQSAQYNSVYCSTGAKLARHEVHAQLNSTAIQANFYGLYRPHGSATHDIMTNIRHLSPECQSFQYYKGILRDQTTGIFNGQIFVAEGAIQTDAKQTNPNILLSESANVYTRPHLEIFADDVKCTHGATVGSLDQNAMFFLRSRGISLGQAQEILTTAFANDVLEQIQNPELVSYITQEP